MEWLNTQAERLDTPIHRFVFRVTMGFLALVAAVGVWTFQYWFDEQVANAPAIIALQTDSEERSLQVSDLTRLVEQLARDNAHDRKTVEGLQLSVRELGTQREVLRLDMVRLEAAVAENTRNARRFEAKMDKYFESRE